MTQKLVRGIKMRVFRLKVSRGVQDEVMTQKLVGGFKMRVFRLNNSLD